MSKVHGFTLIELLIVLAIVAIGTGATILSMRDEAAGELDKDAQRLVALLEAGRAQSQLTGAPIKWAVVGGGFVFVGVQERRSTGDAWPKTWLYTGTVATINSGHSSIALGPEPFVPAQSITLTSKTTPGQKMVIETDGVRPFGVVR